MLARRTDRLRELGESLPTESFVVECDLGLSTSIEKASHEVMAWAPTIDGIVNNAGIFLPAPTGEDLDEIWLKQFQVNLMGPVRLVRHFWPQLQKQKQSSILNISSTLGVRPIANTGAYSASKAALNNWTQSIALEGAAHKIRANSICPGLVDTPIHPFYNSDDPQHLEAYKNSQAIQPLERIGQPSDIAPLAYHLISDSSSWTTGAIINVDGGILLNS